MRRITKYLLVTLAFALAGAIGAAFGTGKAEAVVASLVQVANTTSGPVPSLNVTDPGRIAYQSTVNNTNLCSGGQCNFQFPTVPTGHRVVVQHISGTVTFTAMPAAVAVTIASGPLVLSDFYAPIPSGYSSSSFDQPVLFYVDSSNSVQVVVSGGIFHTGNILQFVTLTGYELDCTVAACAPIATQ